MQTVFAPIMRTVVYGTIIGMVLVSHAFAQTADLDAMRVAIRNQIMADPRSQNLTPAQVQSLVNALSVRAVQQGVTAEQLTAPAAIPENTLSEAAANMPADECAGTPQILCSYNKALGFVGDDHSVVIGLFIASILFIFTYSLMKEIGHPHVTGIEKKIEQ